MIKKIFVSILLCLMAVVTVNAAKSAGTIRLVQQPDGTMLSMQLLGDEHFSWYQTTDGVLLVEKDKVFYVGTVTGTGALESSGIVAHDFGSRSAEEQSAVSKQDKDKFFQQAEVKANQSKIAMGGNMLTAIEGYPSSAFCPHSGTIKVPVILMNYTDTVFTIAETNEKIKEVFDDYFNGTTKTPYSASTKYQGYSSVSQFFKDASNDKLNFQMDIYGPYTTSNKHHHYGHNGNEWDLAKEAVSKADPDIDFSKYDSNNDGKVDMVYIVYAGTGANLSGDDDDFWPKCWYNCSISTSDGKTINVIGGANELAASKGKDGITIRAGIGVTCHEMSHGMGLPDLYWTLSSIPKNAQGYTDYNNNGPEDWDLMDGGENLYNGIWPCQMTAWEKDAMGWLDLEELTEPTDVTIYPLNKEGGKAYKVTNPANPYEYYTIENWQNDEWNWYINYQNGSGLMITHIAMTSSGLSMTPNNTYGKPGVTLLPADGLVLAYYEIGQQYPYQGSVQTISYSQFQTDMKGDPYIGTKATTPVTSLAAYKNYTGDEMVTKYPITDITKNDDGSISFKFMGGKTEPTAIEAVKDQAEQKTGVKKYIRNGKIIILKDGKEFNLAGVKYE